MSLAVGASAPHTSFRGASIPAGLRRLATPALIVPAWQCAFSAGLIGPRAIPSPARIAGTFHEIDLGVSETGEDLAAGSASARDRPAPQQPHGHLARALAGLAGPGRGFEGAIP